jgi:hypothetical protein
MCRAPAAKRTFGHRHLHKDCTEVGVASQPGCCESEQRATRDANSDLIRNDTDHSPISSNFLSPKKAVSESIRHSMKVDGKTTADTVPSIQKGDRPPRSDGQRRRRCSQFKRRRSDADQDSIPSSKLMLEQQTMKAPVSPLDKGTTNTKRARFAVARADARQSSSQQQSSSNKAYSSAVMPAYFPATAYSPNIKASCENSRKRQVLAEIHQNTLGSVREQAPLSRKRWRHPSHNTSLKHIH